MKPARIIKEKLREGEIVTGTIVIDHLWPGMVDIAISAGMDYLLVDLEHGPHNPELVAHVCGMGQLADFAVLVRPPAGDFMTVSRAMDLGPCGLVLPAVETVEAMDTIRDAVYLPPRGRRRPGGQGNRWVSSYHHASWKNELEDHLIVVPQIETPLGLENVDAIAAHEVTTALGVGPYDLSMILGADMNPDHPDFVAALSQIRRAADAANKRAWQVGDPTKLVKQGVTFICLGEPVAVLQKAFEEMVTRAHVDAH